MFLANGARDTLHAWLRVRGREPGPLLWYALVEAGLAPCWLCSELDDQVVLFVAYVCEAFGLDAGVLFAAVCRSGSIECYGQRA